MNIQIGLCGNESISTTNKTDLEYFFKWAAVNGSDPKTFDVDFKFLDGLFKVEMNDGFDECYDSMLRLCMDKECEKLYNQEGIGAVV